MGFNLKYTVFFLPYIPSLPLCKVLSVLDFIFVVGITDSNTFICNDYSLLHYFSGKYNVQISWFYNVLIIAKLKARSAREWSPIAKKIW